MEIIVSIVYNFSHLLLRVKHYNIIKHIYQASMGGKLPLYYTITHKWLHLSKAGETA